VAPGGAAECPRPPAVAPPFDRLTGSFEGRTLRPWTAEGDAFVAPVDRRRLPDGRVIVGWSGRQYVDSLRASEARGDAALGKLVSPPFTIAAPGLSFLVGGGSGPDVGVRLLVDGQPTLDAKGADDLTLRRTFWDLGRFQGRRAQIEIYDRSRGPWGHIRADDFRLEPVGNAGL
jgi:hypothetical protein